MSLTWQQSIKSFETYLRLEKSLSENSVEAYLHDVRKLESYFTEIRKETSPAEVAYTDLKEFLVRYGTESSNTRTQARVLSGIRAFYKFLLIEGEMDENPASDRKSVV